MKATTKPKKTKAPILTGEAAKDIRSRLNMNQQTFWAGLGVTQSGGSRYESGRNIPAPVRRLIYLTHVVGVELSTSQQAAFDAIE